MISFAAAEHEALSFGHMDLHGLACHDGVGEGQVVHCEEGFCKAACLACGPVRTNEWMDCIYPADRAEEDEAE